MNPITQLNKLRAQLRELDVKAEPLEMLDDLTTAQRIELSRLWRAFEALEDLTCKARVKVNYRTCSTEELQAEMALAVAALDGKNALPEGCARKYALHIEEQLLCSLNRDQSRWRIGDKVRVEPHNIWPELEPGGQTGYVTGFDGGNPADGYEVEIDHFEMVPEGLLELIGRPTR